jgi:D-alanyl-D-alanine carboxypeptidase
MKVRIQSLPLSALGILLLGLCLVGFGPPGLVGADDPNTGIGPWVVTASTLGRAAVPPAPAIQASAAAVVDGDSGALVWGKDPHRSLPPASMTKMMTALVALRHDHLDQVVTSDVDAASLAGDSVMGLHVGERLSLRDLLFGLLVPSGDDAALVIAEAVGGSQSGFVQLMNDEAASLGLTDTHFVNPHGLDAPGHVSSPYDLIAIGRVAMRDPLFRQIVATRQITIRGRWTYNLTNTNYFLGRRPGVVGIKTGTTDLALHNITVADQRDGHLLYLTVMHTPDYVPDATALLNYFEANDTWVSLDLPPGPLRQADTPAGPRTLSVATASSAYLPRWQADDLAWQVDATPNAPLRATDNPDLPPPDDGAVTVYAGGEPVARLPLVAK